MEWQRIIDLVKKTGERCVVIDPDHDEPVVVMPLSEYEFLAENAEEEIVDYEDLCDFAEDLVPEGIPFEPLENTWETPEPLENKQYIESETDDLVTEEQWYIEPISDEG